MSAKRNSSENTQPSPDPVDVCTLFVSTRTGQLRNEIGFVERYSPKHPRSMIMTPKKDGTLRRNLRYMVEKSPFEAFEITILPNFPTSPRGVKRKIRVYNAMRDTLERLVGGCKHVDLYLHHADNYYVFFERIFAELGIEDYTMSMLEEGLATYKWTCPELENEVVETKLYTPIEAARDVAGELVAAVKSFLRIFVHLLKFLERIVEFIVACLSKLTGRNLFDSAARIAAKFLPKKYRYGIVQHFGDGWFCFPEKMEKVRLFHIDNLHAFPFVTGGKSGDDRNVLDQTDVIFASQRYGNPEIYYEIVLTILEEMHVDVVCFKLHPREEYGQIAEHLHAAQKNHPGVRVLHNRELDAIPVEELLEDGSCRTLVGLTTSALMYAPLVDDTVALVSIADRFFELYKKLDPSGLAGQGSELQAFRKDLDVFHAVAPEVPQFRTETARETPIIDAEESTSVHTGRE